MDIISAKVNKVTLVIKRNYIHALMQSVCNTLCHQSAVIVLRHDTSPGLPGLV